MRIKKVLKNEYVFSVITRVIIIVTLFAHSVIVARFLGAALQGVNSFVSSSVSICSIIVTCGIHHSYPYLRSKYGKDCFFLEYVNTVFFYFLILEVMSMMLCGCVVMDIEYRAICILSPFVGYTNVISYINLIESPNRNNFISLIISIADLAFALFLLLFIHPEIHLAIILFAFAEVLKCFVFSYNLRTFPNIKRFNYNLLFQMIGYGVVPMVSLLMTTLNYKIDILMLKSYPFITSAQIGIYSIGMGIADKVAIIPDTLKDVLVSKLSKGASEKEVAKVCRLSFGASFFICLALLFLGKPLLGLLYGKEYEGAFDVLVICMFGSLFVGYFKLIAQYNIVNRKQGRNLALLSFSVLINFILNIVLIPKYFLKGAAFASGVGYFISGVIFVIWFARSNKLKLKELFLIRKEEFLIVFTSLNRTIGRKEK